MELQLKSTVLATNGMSYLQASQVFYVDFKIMMWQTRSNQIEMIPSILRMVLLGCFRLKWDIKVTIKDEGFEEP